MADIEHLIEDLLNENPVTRMSAAIALNEAANSGQDISLSYHTLRILLHDADKEVRYASAEALSHRFKSKGDANLEKHGKKLEVFKESSNEEKLRTISWVASIVTQDKEACAEDKCIEFALPMIAISLFDKDIGIVLAALKAIKVAANDGQDVVDVIPSVVKLLSSEQDEVRKQASVVLQQIAINEVDLTDHLPILYHHLFSSHNSVKFGVADALTYFYAINGDWYEVKKLLNHKDKDVRQEAAGTLAQGNKIDLEQIFPDVKKLLADDNEDVQIVAAKTIAKGAKEIKDIKLILPIVKEQLSSSKDDNRVYAARIVEEIFKDKPEDMQGSLEPLMLDFELRLTAEQNPKIKEIVARVLLSC
ncbi:MAG: HEAT repeat domain-containing protein [Candidatus Hodarchaeota archaeon]